MMMLIMTQSLTPVGLVLTANKVLDKALRPGNHDFRRQLAGDCIAGIAILRAVDAGFLANGSAGSGILLKRDASTGRWSPPVAFGLGGLGFGFTGGAAYRDVLVFLPREQDVDAFTKAGVQFVGDYEIAVGVGRGFEGGVGASKGGIRYANAITYTKGAFVSATSKVYITAPRHNMNHHFYHTKSSKDEETSKHYAKMILNNQVLFPEDNPAAIAEWNDLSAKLEILASELIHQKDRKKDDQEPLLSNTEKENQSSPSEE